LDCLESRGLKTGVVTNTPKGLMGLILETVGLTGRFASVMSADEVESGKPQPDMLHLSCRRLGVREEETLMVGDTRMDIEAARNAGLRSVGIGIRGDWTIKDIGELPGIMKRAGL